MPKPQKPLTPAQVKKELARFKKALKASEKRQARAFKTAARKAALAEAEELAKKYEASGREMRVFIEGVFTATLNKTRAEQAMVGDPQLVGSADAAETELKRAVSKLADMKSAALQALAKNRSDRMAALLNEQGLVNCGIGPKDLKPKPGKKYPPKCPKDPPGQDDNDEHSDNVDS